MQLFRIGALALGCLLGACTSVEWAPVPDDLPSRWGKYDLHVGGEVDVLATSEGTASDGYQEIEKLLVALQAEVGKPLGRGLVIAVDSDDPPLIDEGVDETFAKIAALHAAAIGQEGIKGRRIGQLGPRAPKSLDPMIFTKMLPYGVPKHGGLGLPHRLLDRADWVLVYPTEDTMEDGMATMIDAMLAEKLSWWQRTLLMPFLPLLRGASAEMMRVELVTPALDVMLTQVDADKKAKRRWKTASLEKLGMTKKQVTEKYMDDPQVQGLMSKQKQETDNPKLKKLLADMERQRKAHEAARARRQKEQPDK